MECLLVKDFLIIVIDIDCELTITREIPKNKITN